MNILTKHLIEAKKGYFEHLKDAFSYCIKSFVASACFLIHAIFPFLFIQTGSNFLSKVLVNIQKTPKCYKTVIFVDIDETICNTNGMDYETSKPNKKSISIINELYNRGIYIVYWTARGSGSGLDWRQLTSKQLDNWGCRYNEIRMDKPVYNMFIDDKNWNSAILKTDDADKLISRIKNDY